MFPWKSRSASTHLHHSQQWEPEPRIFMDQFLFGCLFIISGCLIELIHASFTSNFVSFLFHVQCIMYTLYSVQHGKALSRPANQRERGEWNYNKWFWLESLAVSIQPFWIIRLLAGWLSLYTSFWKTKTSARYWLPTRCRYELGEIHF